MKNLQVYNWNFGCLPMQSNIKPRVIILTVQNVGGTDLNWNFKLPSDSQIEVEPWADPGEPTEEEAFEKIILEKKIFEIKPKSGFLKPGQLADIQIIYNPQNQLNENGQQGPEKHFLQVVIQILNGKPLVIHLRGMTIALMKGMLTLRKNEFTLPDMPVGMLVPLTFPIEINNEGSANVSYKIQTKEISERGLSQGNKNLKIFDIKNLSGTLNAGEKQYLYCLFRPLEQKLYHFQFTIEVFDHQQQIDKIDVNVKCAGYFKQPTKAIEEKEELPSQRSQVSTIGSQVCFSVEEIDFGEVCNNEREHRILILYNLSDTNKLNFTFKNTGLVCGDDLLIEPLQGTILPKQFIEIKLTLFQNILPSIYEGEIECKILWTEKLNCQKDNLDETLFLRIKKRSQLSQVNNTNSLIYEPQEADEDQAHLQIIFNRCIADILNDPDILKRLDIVDDQHIQLFSQFDDKNQEDQPQLDIQSLQDLGQNLPNLDNPQEIFLNQEFLENVDNIFENTFFNLIQESTRQETDLLKVSKTFLTPNKV